MNMKNFLKISLSVCAGLLMLTSCHEITTDGVTRITYYPTLELHGGEMITQPLGTAYTDPGFTATLNGEDVGPDVVVEGTVNANVAGVYSITYTYTNVDGFAATAHREVVVAAEEQLLPSLDIPYNVTVSRNGVTAASMNYTQPWPGTLTHLIGDTYLISDLISGWYQARFNVSNPALVPLTNCLGVVTITGSDVVLLKAYADNYWGTVPTKTGATNVIGTYNSVNGSISISTLWSGYTFNGVYVPALL